MAKATVIEAEVLETEGETTENEMNGVDGKYIVLPVYKALQVLMMLSERGKLTLKEVYLELGISKAQAFRYLQTLCASSFAEYDDETGLYHLGIRSWELGQSSTRYAKLLELAQPFMQDLRDRFNETVNLGTLSGSKVIYLGMVESSHSLRMHATIGSFDPVYTTSLGKAMLAFYPEDTWPAHVPEKLVPRTHRTITTREALWKELRITKERGYSLDEGENEIGACCVGAPVFDRHQKVVAAVSLSAPSSRLQGDFIKDAAKAVMSTAEAISQRLKG